MTRPLFSAHSFPADRVRPGVGLSVVALHLALLWIANLYWPLQVAVQGVVVQIFRSHVRVDTSAIAAKAQASLTPDAALARNPRSISTGSPRVGRAETQLDLPATPPAAQQSTPLASTQQLRLSTPSPAAQAAVEVTMPPAPPAPAPQNASVVAEPAALAASSPLFSSPVPPPLVLLQPPVPPPLTEQSAQKSAEPRLTQTLPELPQAQPAPALVALPPSPPAIAAPLWPQRQAGLCNPKFTCVRQPTRPMLL